MGALAADRMTGAGLEQLFSAWGPLAKAEPAARTRFLALARPVMVPRGSQVFAAGDGFGGLYGVVSGGIGVEGVTRHLGPRLGHVYRAGGWFGEGPAMSGGPRKLGHRALEDSQLVLVPLPALQQWQRDDIGIARLLGVISEINSNIAACVARELLIPEAPRRIAAVLLRVTGSHEGLEPTDAQGFWLAQADLGEMANASRHSVGRALGQFERWGWIAKSYNHIRVMDVPALSAFAYSEG